MSERSPAFQRLCEAALAHFATAGYDGASLNAVAGLLGIKKASLYSHIASKDALYLLLLDDALQAETAFAETCFAQSAPQELPGAAYLQALPARYATSAHLQFLLRAAYLSPQVHKQTIYHAYADFYGGMGALFAAALKTFSGPRLNPEDQALYTEAWLGMVDGLSVELLYGPPERADFRLQAMLRMLGDALRA